VVQDTDKYIDEHHTGRERDQGSGSRVSVYEAADLLGVTVDAIRKRIQRGTIPHERHEDGRVYVVLDEARALQDKSSKPTSTVQDDRQVPYQTNELVTELRAQNEWLRREVERKDAILLRMAERMPELEPAPEQREGLVAHATAPEGADKGKVPPEQQEPTQRRTWWRQFFGLQ
jgi:hypothetical protein